VCSAMLLIRECERYDVTYDHGPEGSSMVSNEEPLVQIDNEPPRYGLVAIALHWISTLFIIVVGVPGAPTDAILLRSLRTVGGGHERQGWRARAL
jgi:hypothetical protein